VAAWNAALRSKRTHAPRRPTRISVVSKPSLSSSSRHCAAGPRSTATLTYRWLAKQGGISRKAIPRQLPRPPRSGASSVLPNSARQESLDLRTHQPSRSGSAYGHRSGSGPDGPTAPEWVRLRRCFPRLRPVLVAARCLRRSPRGLGVSRTPRPGQDRRAGEQEPRRRSRLQCPLRQRAACSAGGSPSGEDDERDRNADGGAEGGAGPWLEVASATSGALIDRR